MISLPANLPFPPLIERELRIALRKKEARKTRMRAAYIGGGIAGLFILLSLIGVKVGMHTWLFCVGLYYAVPDALHLTCDMFAAEWENQTMGLLFLTGLKEREIFLSKILGHFLIAANNLLALMPFIAVPFLMGGISLTLFFAMLCCLPVILIYVVSVSTLGAVLCEDESNGLATASVIGVLMSLTTPALAWAGQLSANFLPEKWLLLSPAYGPWLIYHDLTSAPVASFWQNMLITLIWSLLIFTLAAAIFRRTWQRTPGQGWTWQGRWRAWIHGDKTWRKQIAGLLETNPFAWLAVYDRQPQRLAWAIVGGLFGLWLLCWFLLPHIWLSVGNFFITSYVLSLVLSLVRVYAPAKNMADHRRQQTMECLLTTPLTVEEIVHGQKMALPLQFRGLMRFLLILNITMMAAGLLLHDWNWRSLTVYFVIWIFLFWMNAPRKNSSVCTPMWVGLVVGRPLRALRGNSSLYNWMYMLFNLRNIGRFGMGGFPTGSVTEFVICMFIAVIALILWVCYRDEPDKMEAQLIREFREVAAEPLPEANDPRLKNWKINERLSASSDLLRV